MDERYAPLFLGNGIEQRFPFRFATPKWSRHENLVLELITFVSSCERYVHLFSLAIGRLRGAVRRELHSYTEGPWFVSSTAVIFFVVSFYPFS